MLKNLKKVAAIVLSFAMAVQFGLADSYYVNAVEEPVEPQQQEETTTTTPQEQEQVPTTEEETPQQQEEGQQQQPAVEEEQPAAEEAQQQPAVEEEQPATEEAQPQPQPVEQAEVKVSYVKENDTDLMESVTATYDVGYRLDQDTNVFKEAHEAFEFEYAFVNGNKENKITKDQVKASGLTVTSDMTSLTLVYKSTATQKDSKDKKVKKANLSGKKEDDSDSDSEEKNISVASDTATTRTIKVGETVTLTSKDVDKHEFYNHNWTVEDGSKVKLNKTSGVSITVTGLKEGTTTVTDTYLYKRTKTYTITVNAAVTPTGISISGADKVTQFQTTQLTANLTPADANGKVTWTSSNEEILSVDENGLVTGNRQGSATITASVQGADNKTLSATKTIEVVKNESPSGNNKREAAVYYLIDPTKDANSNDTGNFGSQYGIANVNVEGATWRDNKNCFDNVDQRVVLWPNGTNVIPKNSEHWNIIFDNYKLNIQSQLGVEITADDVEEITLVPAKISRNNGTNPDMHLDCNVNIKCKSVALVKYYLFDANGTNWEMLGSKNYLVKDESKTQPSDVTSENFPTTKTVNGVTYTFSGWYTDQSLTTPAPSFPAKVTGSVTYYAKYVAGYQVTYNLAGGQFSDGSTSAIEKHNVDTDVVVKEAPTRKGYKFTGWTVEGLDGTTTINSGDRFTMPNVNVTLTANWQEQKIAEYITLMPTDVIKPYDGKTYTAGTATVSGKTASPIPTDLKIEYSVDGNTWTTDPSTITATNVSDSKTVKVRVSSDNYTGKLEDTEELTITPAEVTVTITGNTKNDTYDETEKTVTGYTFEKTNNLYTDADFGLKDGAKAEAKGTNAGTYQMGLTEDSFENKNANFEVTFKVTDGWLKIDKKSIIPDGPNTPEEKKTGINVTAPKDTTYSGNEQKKEPVIEDTNTGKTLDKDDYSLSYSDDVTNAGTVTITVAGKGNYTGKFEVIYKINPRKVTLKSETASKPYDGTVLTKPAVKVSGDGFVEGEVSDIKATGSVTTVSEGEVTNTITFTKGKGYKDDNYKIEKEEGKLSITAKAIVPDGPNTPDEKKTGITVNEPSDSKYDGKEHREVLTVTDTKTGKELVAGTDYSVTYSSDLVNAGTVKVTVAGLGNYTGSFTKTYKITKRSVTLTSATASKVYDGSALTNTSITVSGDGFVEGEGASYEVTGTQTEVGNSANAFEYKLNEKTLASNYNITKVVGTLTITAAPAPVTPATPSTPSTPSSTTSTTPRTLSAPQVTTPVETVEKETTPKAEPKKEEKVEEEYTPKASPQYYWALINLICAILTVLFGLLLLISKRHKSEDDDEEDDETKQQTTNDDEEKEQEKKRGLFTRVLAVLIAIVSVVFFLVTEDLSLPWTWTDQWTIWMVVIGLVQIVVFFVGRKWKNVDNDDEDEEAQQA